MTKNAKGLGWLSVDVLDRPYYLILSMTGHRISQLFSVTGSQILGRGRGHGLNVPLFAPLFITAALQAWGWGQPRWCHLDRASSVVRCLRQLCCRA